MKLIKKKKRTDPLKDVDPNCDTKNTDNKMVDYAVRMIHIMFQKLNNQNVSLEYVKDLPNGKENQNKACKRLLELDPHEYSMNFSMQKKKKITQILSNDNLSSQDRNSNK